MAEIDVPVRVACCLPSVLDALSWRRLIVIFRTPTFIIVNLIVVCLCSLVLSVFLSFLEVGSIEAENASRSLFVLCCYSVCVSVIWSAF